MSLLITDDLMSLVTVKECFTALFDLIFLIETLCVFLERHKDEVSFDCEKCENIYIVMNARLLELSTIINCWCAAGSDETKLLRTNSPLKCQVLF